METLMTNSNVSDADLWKNIAANEAATNNEDSSKQCKRYRDSEQQQLNNAQPQPKKLMLFRQSRFQDPKNLATLSPITEISVNLSEASLNTPQGVMTFRKSSKFEEDEDTTPRKSGRTKGFRERKSQFLCMDEDTKLGKSIF